MKGSPKESMSYTKRKSDEMAEVHTIFLFGRQAVCPACSGMITKDGEVEFRCVDCNERYEAIEPGASDSELVVRHIEKEGVQVEGVGC